MKHWKIYENDSDNRNYNYCYYDISNQYGWWHVMLNITIIIITIILTVTNREIPCYIYGVNASIEIYR